MSLVLSSKIRGVRVKNAEERAVEAEAVVMPEPGQRNLTHVPVNEPCVIKGIQTRDQGVKDFLFTLGCFEGETVTVISTLAENYIIHVKDARYSIDSELAAAILI